MKGYMYQSRIATKHDMLRKKLLSGRVAVFVRTQLLYNYAVAVFVGFRPIQLRR